MERIAPPRLALFCLALLYPAPLGEAIAGDLCEEFRLQAGLHGQGTAARWYWRQVMGSAWYALRRRWLAGDVAALLICCGLSLGALWLVGEAGRFVLSQVPRRASAQLPLAYEIVRWLVAAALPAAGFHWRRQERGERWK